jgi:uncharacterized protein DUF3786
MTDLIDRIYFQDLSERDPKDVCRRASCKYDDMNELYRLPVWGDEYGIYPSQLKINCMGNSTQGLHDYFYLFIIHYLLKSKEIEISNEWISGKDIPGGTTFFRGPHEIPTNLISLRFNNNINEFKKRCEQLHGIPLNMADAAYIFEITPRIPVAVLYCLEQEKGHISLQKGLNVFGAITHERRLEIVQTLHYRFQGHPC